MVLLAVVLTAVGGAALLADLDGTRDAATTMPVLEAFVFVGVATIGAVTTWLRQLEREVLSTLRTMTHPPTPAQD